jgi:uncharacterized protein YyaL (SSP411 family)
MVQWFWDDDMGVFFDTASDAERLITRPRDPADNATPSGTSLAVELLLYISELQHDPSYRRRAAFTLETLADLVARHPSAFGHLLGSMDMELKGAIEVALVGERKDPPFQALERIVAEQYVPSLVLAGGSGDGVGSVKLLEGRSLQGGKPTAYVCRGYTCELPVTEPRELARQLESAARVSTTA